MMKRLLLFLGTLAAGFLLFGSLISGIGWQEVLKPLGTLSLFGACVIVLLTAIALLIGTARWHFILQKQKCAVSFWSAWKAYLAGFSLLFFVPMFPFASELFRASALKEQHQVDFPKGMASVIIDRVLEVTSNLLVVLVGGIIFFLGGSTVSYTLKTMGVIGFVGVWIVLLVFLYSRIFRKQSVVRLFWKDNGNMRATEQELFQFFQLKNAALWQGVGLSLAKSFVGIVRTWTMLFLFGKGLVVLPGIAIHGFYYLAALVPIPAALGSHETLQAVSFGAFGLGVGTGAAFALLVRAVELLFAAVGALILFHFGLRFFKHIKLNFHEQ